MRRDQEAPAQRAAVQKKGSQNEWTRKDIDMEERKKTHSAGDGQSEVLNGRRPRADKRLIEDILSTGPTSATTGSVDAIAEIPPSRLLDEREPAAKAFAGTPPSR